MKKQQHSTFKLGQLGHFLFVMASVLLLAGMSRSAALAETTRIPDNAIHAQQAQPPIDVKDLQALYASMIRIDSANPVQIASGEDGFIVYAEAVVESRYITRLTAQMMLASTLVRLSITDFTVILHDADEGVMYNWQVGIGWQESEPDSLEALREIVELNSGISLSPTEVSEPVTYYALSNANVRSCAEIACDVVGGLRQGQAVAVVGSVDGQAVNAENTLWYEIELDGDTGYVYGGLLTDQQTVSVPQQPVQQQPVQQQAQPTAQVSEPLPPTAIPTQAPISTPVPVGPVSPYTCNGIDDLNCGDFATWEQANAHYQMCGNEDRLDGNDNDGFVCESMR